MKKNLASLFDFIERNTKHSASCENLPEAIVTYAEHFVRMRNEGKKVEADLYKTAALNYAFLLSWHKTGKFYSSIDKNFYRGEGDIKDLIVNYALKVIKAQCEDNPRKEFLIDLYENDLITAVTRFILEKDTPKEIEE